LRPTIPALLLLSFLAAPACCDELTPSGGLQDGESTAAAAVAPVPPAIRYRDVADELGAVYSVTLDTMAQVAQNSHNWQGPQDASAKCEVGFAQDALVIRGEVLDDHPFHQTLAKPAMPDWWKITYGADGLELRFDDPSSGTRRLRLALNFGSRATRPRVDLLQSPSGRAPGPVGSADMRLSDAPARAGAGEGAGPPPAPVRFEAAVPFEALADPGFFAGPLRITVKLHDLDGDWATYLMMTDTIEKK
jgi:hypothetical protein